MLEKDQFEQFLSKSFENQTEAVRPDLWSGVQAKMIANGVASTAAVKSVSILTKWILGSLAVGTAATISTLVLFNNNEDTKKELIAPKTAQEISVNENVASKNKIAKVISLENTNSLHEEILDESNSVLVFEALNIPDFTENIISEKNELINDEKVIVIPDPIKDVVIVVPTTEDVKEELKDPIVIGKASVTKFPNFFSPNGDGSNDFYEIEIENISNFHVIIMNQNNKIVFESTDSNFKWNAEVAGEKATQGTFACIVTGTDPQGTKFKDVQLFEIK